MAAILSAAAPIRVNTRGLALGSVLFTAWVAILVFAFRTFRWRSLWFLLGSPFALIFVLMFWFEEFVQNSK